MVFDLQVPTSNLSYTDNVPEFEPFEGVAESEATPRGFPPDGGEMCLHRPSLCAMDLLVSSPAVLFEDLMSCHMLPLMTTGR